MIFYIASPLYHQSILSAIKEEDELILGNQVNERILFLDFMKKNISKFPSEMEKLLIDLSALHDEDEKILESIKMFRMLNDKVRVIIVAPDRIQGDELLSKIFSLGIWDIIATADYLELKKQIRTCITTGKSFKEAVVYKDVKRVEGFVSREERKKVNKVTVGIAGTQGRIGVTHNLVNLAGCLRKMGYLVAVVECNQNNDFQKIREDFSARVYENQYFTLDGIDYYPNMAHKIFEPILDKKGYNFALYDFGIYQDADTEAYHKCHEKIIVSGSKAWEISYMGEILKVLPEEELFQIHYLFNFTNKNFEKPIIQSLKMPAGRQLKINFLEYNSDPFNQTEFRNINRIFKDYLPEQIKEKKTFPFFKKKLIPKRKQITV